MRDFQDKTKNKGLKRIFYSPFGIVFLGILVLVFAWGVINFLLTMQETIKNKEIAQKKVTELERRKDKLIKDIDELNTDKGKEKVFREDFGMGREGEGLIIVVEDKNSKVGKEDSPKNELFPSFKSFFSRLIGNK